MQRRFLLKTVLGLPLISFLLIKCQSKSESLEAVIQINLKQVIRDVNRKVLGAGLMFAPFKTHEPIISTMFGKGTSARLWPGSLIDEEFDEKRNLIVSLAPSQVLAFSERSAHGNEKISYESENKNNLETYQKSDKIVKDIEWILSRLNQVSYPPEGQSLYWEAWNEPQFEQNGGWDADAFANYVNDLAAKIKQSKLSVKVGAALHMDDSDWNNQLCKKLDPEIVDFLVTHYYGFWENIEIPNNNFLARAGFGVALRERVKSDLELIKIHGNNNWTLHCSEWNLHPPNYKPPYNTTRDIAAALYALSAIKIYLEEGIESAQYFLISSAEHFGTISIEKDDTVKIHPTGAAFKLMNKCLQGKLLKADIKSPEYTLKAKRIAGKGKSYSESYQVPFIEAISCLWDDGTVNILLGNKHETQSANLSIQGISMPDKLTMQTVSENINKDEQVSDLKKSLAQNNKSQKSITIPAKSITAITINSS
jgi:alpha-L-arabinofuranosidase